MGTILTLLAPVKNTGDQVDIDVYLLVVTFRIELEIEQEPDREFRTLEGVEVLNAPGELGPFFHRPTPGDDFLLLI